jgi:SP family sugar:H+ symporter-like MFS transporter
MGFFDNLRGWDKFKVYRYVILLALSLSGDGWYVPRHDRGGS